MIEIAYVENESNKEIVDNISKYKFSIYNSPQNNSPIILGRSGYFHNLTYNFIKKIGHVDNYIHIDAHSDSLLYDGSINYSSFVYFLQSEGLVGNVINIGLNDFQDPKSINLEKYYNNLDFLANNLFFRTDKKKEFKVFFANDLWKQSIIANPTILLKNRNKLTSLQKSNFKLDNRDYEFFNFEYLCFKKFDLNMIPKGKTYISIDLDVCKEGFITDFDKNHETGFGGAGNLSVKELFDLVSKLIENNDEIVGVDICGISERFSKFGKIEKKITINNLIGLFDVLTSKGVTDEK